MKKKVFGLILFCTVIFFCSSCKTNGSQVTEPTSPPQENPTSVANPTEVPPTEVPTQVPPPTIEPTETPIVLIHWSKHSSTGTELSFRHPGEWFGPASLPFGEGVYIKDPDKDIGVIIQLELAGEPAQFLTQFATSGIDIPGLLTYVPETAEEADPVIVSRIQANTQLTEGNGLKAQATYLQRPEDVMGVIWYAPIDQWDELAETFYEILTTIEVWTKHTDLGLHTMYLHDWPEPSVPPEGEGIWFQSADQKTGMLILIGGIEDPIKLLTDWTPDHMTALGMSNYDTPTQGDRMDGLSGDWESKTGTCSDASGEALTYEIAFMANKDRVLEIIIYSLSNQWEYATGIFDTMLGLLTDIR